MVLNSDNEESDNSSVKTLHWRQVQNRDHILGHGPSRLRADAVDIIEHGIRAADPYRATLSLLKLDGDLLRVGSLEYDLRDRENIYVVGAGKATQAIAMALEAILADRITDGVVILKRGETHRLQKIRIMEAGHPVPDEDSYRGAQQIVRLARGAGPRDLVFSAITGGSSALMIWPAEGISVNDKRLLHEILLWSGASIREINAVRKHTSRIKGGLLGLEVLPAELINLTVSDVVGDPLDYITGPTVPDTSTYADAWRTVDKYSLWDRVPESVRDYLKRGPEIETPKNYPRDHSTYIVVPGDTACLGAVDRCRQLGYETRLLTTEIEGESHEQGALFVSRAFSLVQDTKAIAVVAGGETTVAIDGEHGQGGPNQEFALSAALAIAGHESTVVVSVDTDGTDGPTDASGGIVDEASLERAKQAGLDPETLLRQHATRALLEITGDLIITGPTGTNVNNLMVLLVEPGRVFDDKSPLDRRTASP